MSGINRKYPRTFHVPSSPGSGSDDKVLTSLDAFLSKSLVFTEKLDGSNACLTKVGVFARSHAKLAVHPSFSLLKQKHSEIEHLMDDDTQIFLENCFAVHSIKYESLSSYHFIIGIRKNDLWLSQDEVKEYSQVLGIPMVPVLDNKTFTSVKELDKAILKLSLGPSSFGKEKEGIVIRNAGQFKDPDFKDNVAKWVRLNHVITDDHWMHQVMQRQGLRKV